MTILSFETMHSPDGEYWRISVRAVLHSSYSKKNWYSGPTSFTGHPFIWVVGSDSFIQHYSFWVKNPVSTNIERFRYIWQNSWKM